MKLGWNQVIVFIWNIGQKSRLKRKTNHLSKSDNPQISGLTQTHTHTQTLSFFLSLFYTLFLSLFSEYSKIALFSLLFPLSLWILKHTISSLFNRCFYCVAFDLSILLAIRTKTFSSFFATWIEDEGKKWDILLQLPVELVDFFFICLV